MERNIELLKAFADPTRLRLMHLLARRGPEVCVCDIVEVLQAPQSTISRQIGPLRMLGLVKGRRVRTWVHYSLVKPEGPFHESLLKLLDRCGGGGDQFAKDLDRFDRLMKRRALACCREESDGIPLVIRSIGRKRRKTSQRRRKR